MPAIVTSRKKDDGIIVVWSESGRIRDCSFTFPELLGMKIEADDLLGRPMLYKIEFELNKYVLKR